jgi:hypothetical protein
MVHGIGGEPGTRVRLAVAAAGVVLMAGLAGWGGAMVAVSSTDTASATTSVTAAQPQLSAGPAMPLTTLPTAMTPQSTAAPTAASTTMTITATPATPDVPDSPIPQATNGSAFGTPGAPPPADVPEPATEDEPVPATSSQEPAQPDIVFVSPSGSPTGGSWYYRVGLIGFPAETVVELTQRDALGGVLLAPLVLTMPDGSSNPYTRGFSTNFAYEGTCTDPRPSTVTARGVGFSITEVVPRPLECDGGRTPDGPWTRPIQTSAAPPAPSPPPTPRS